MLKSTEIEVKMTTFNLTTLRVAKMLSWRETYKCINHYLSRTDSKKRPYW